VRDALDDFRYSAGSLVAGSSQQLHLGWFCSPAFGASSGGSDIPAAHWTPSGDISRIWSCGTIPTGDFQGETRMDSNEIKGKMKDVAGKAQEKFGEATGSKEQEIKGMGKQVEGKVQETFGKTKDAMRDADENFRKRQSDVQPDRDDEIGNRDIEKDENAA
jgi:uncharacterized protein YjbJ (UPF0337 family)